MIISFYMKFMNLLILFSFFLYFLISCASIDTIQTLDSCLLFKEKKQWYKATKKSFDEWDTPIEFQLAVIRQESSFKQFAKPKRERLFGIVPFSRPTTAFAYAQVTNPTWNWYKTRTNNNNASRANFDDVTDFIGWYSEQTKKMLGIDKKDFYNQYLAYHEGHGGWKNKSYKSKKWLIEVAKNVEINAKEYKNQLNQCQDQLNRKGFFSFL